MRATLLPAFARARLELCVGCSELPLTGCSALAPRFTLRFWLGGEGGGKMNAVQPVFHQSKGSQVSIRVKQPYEDCCNIIANFKRRRRTAN